MRRIVVCFSLILAGVGLASAQTSPVSSGTGFFVSADGWVLTNAHVLDGCGKLTIGDVGEATEMRVDRQNDLAAVRTSSGREIKNTIVIRLKPARLGEDVAALGFPLSSVLSSSIKITTGNINSLLGIDDDSRYLQVSAPIQPGNSGGPLVDETGALVGVMTATLKPSAQAEMLPQNVNFAIRSSVVATFLSGHGIDYDTAPGSSPELRTADLADLVAPAVVAIQCFDKKEDTASSTNHEHARSEPPPRFDASMTPEQRARAFAVAYHDAWSLPNDAALAFMRAAYAAPLTFYGNRTTANEVFDEKRRFAERWPIRGYSVRLDSLDISCAGYLCAVSATVDWFAYSPQRSKKSSGVATSIFTVDTEDYWIKSETSAVIKGAPADPSGLVERWAVLNGRCRGGSGDSATVTQACDDREHSDIILRANGWCFGRIGEAGYQMEWHRCSRNSLAQ